MTLSDERLAEIIEETSARMARATENANTTRSSEAWNFYIADRRYFRDVAEALAQVKALREWVATLPPPIREKWDEFLAASPVRVFNEECGK